MQSLWLCSATALQAKDNSIKRARQRAWPRHGRFSQTVQLGQALGWTGRVLAQPRVKMPWVPSPALHRLSVMLPICPPSTEEAGAEFKVTLGHLEKSRAAWATWQAVSNKQNRTKKLT